MKHLKDIAEIRSGHPFRGKLENSPAGNVVALQMKDVTNSFVIDFKNSIRLQLSDVKERYLVAPKDIVFRSRGQTNTCAIINDIEGTAVIAAPMFQIRATSADVLPEYLCWFINQPIAQSYFDRNARGTAGRMIGQDSLKDLEIDIPPLEIQQSIIGLAELSLHEQQLMKQLAEKKKILVSEILMRVASEGGNDAEKERLPEVGLAPQEDKDSHSKP